MIAVARQIARILLGRQMAARNVAVRPDDVFLVSYPKSGNTWLRFLVGNLAAADEPVTFSNLESRIPDIYKHTERQLGRIAGPRVLKSHEYFDPRYPRVVYVVRDPRDVVVSYFHYHVKVRLLDDGDSLGRFVERFVAGDLDPYGSWADNVSSWLGGRADHPGFLMVRYEDLVDDAARELARIAAFLRVAGVDTNRIESAVRASSSEKMRRLEQEQGAAWVTVRGTREDVPFIRSARSGGWRDELDDRSIRTIGDAWAPLMERLGYTAG